MVGLHTESSSPEPHDAELIGLSLAASPEEVWYLPFGHRVNGRELDPKKASGASASYRRLKRIAGRASDRPRSAQGRSQYQFDWQVLRAAGVELAE